MFFITVLIVFLVLLYKKKYSGIYLLFIFSIIAVPNNNYIEGIIGTKIFLDIRDLIPALMLIVVMLKRNFKFDFNISNLFFSLVVFLIFITSAISGVLNENVFVDFEGRLYVLIIMKVVALYLWVKTFEIRRSTMINGLVFGALIYSTICISIYLFGTNILDSLYGDFYSDIWTKTGRVSFNNTSSLFIVVLLNLYMILSREYRLLNYISLITSIVTILLSQSRSILILLFITLILLFISYLTKVILIPNSKKLLILSSILFMGPLTLVLIYFTQNLNFTFLENIKLRLLNWNGGSVSSRLYTNEYNLALWENKTFGDGLGKPMYFYDADFKLVSIDPWIDNLYIYILMKFGLVGIIIFLLLVSKILYKYTKAVLFEHDSLAFIILIGFIPFLIIISVLSSQLLHSSPVFITFVLLFVLLRQNISNKGFEN